MEYVLEIQTFCTCARNQRSSPCRLSIPVVDFYEYVKFKWGNDRAEGIRGWIGNGLIKSKELLQFNQDDNLEQYKIFIGSKEFIDGEKDILINSLIPETNIND